LGTVVISKKKETASEGSFKLSKSFNKEIKRQLTGSTKASPIKWAEK
jgi:hypothetical protein